MKTILINVSSYLIYLTPLALLTGPALPDIFISLTGTIFLFLVIKDKEFFYFKNYFFYFFFLFYFYINVNSVLSDSIILSLKSSFFYIRFFLLSLAIWYLIENNSNFLKYFFYFLFATFMFALIDGYSQYFLNHNLFGYPKPGLRLFLTFDQRLILGGYLVRLIPLLFALILVSYSNVKFKPYILIIILISTDILVYISGERTAFALLTLFTILIILFVSKYKTLRIFTFILSLIIIILITYFDKDIRYRNIEHTINQVTSSAVSDENEVSKFVIYSDEHHSYISTAFNMFKKKPIFGHGPNSFRIHCNNLELKFNQYGCTTHPHNTYIQLLSEIGIIGTLFVCFIFFYLIKKIFLNLYYSLKASKKIIFLDDYQILLLICFIMTLWPIFPTKNFFNNWINIIYYLPVGFYLQSIYSGIGNRSKNK